MFAKTPTTVFALTLLLTAELFAAELTTGIIEEACGVRGGLVVQVGAGDRAFPEGLGRTGRFLVQVLDRDIRTVEEARKAFHAAGLYGLVSADGLDEGRRLPYAENLVNLLVLSEEAGARIETAEAMRVLCPGGVLIGPAGRLTPETLKAAGFQEVRLGVGEGAWRAGRKPWPAEMDAWPQPRHGPDGNAASRDRLVGPPRRVRWIAGPPQEIANMVSSAGRNFYGGVLARDAFNGLRLWQQRLSPSAARGGYHYGRTVTAPKPLAVDAMLLAFDQGGVVAFDGASGKVIRQYPEAGKPLEMLADGGLLLATDRDALRAVEIETGRLRWTHEAVEPRCVVAGDGSVYLLEGQIRAQDCAIAALDLKTGRLRWRTADLAWIKGVRNLVYHKGVLACEISTLSNDKEGNGIEILSAADGQPAQSQQFLPGTTHWHQARTIFVDDLLWNQTTKGWTGTDWRSGQLKHTFRAGTGHCFPPVATARYLLAGEMHLTDLDTGLVDINPITKGNCSRDAGFMPANGLIYTAPKHCICWPMLRDYTALAPALSEPAEKPAHLLQRGPAQAPSPAAAAASEMDWPCYRRDPFRSGSSLATVPTQFKVRWSRQLATWPNDGPIATDWRDDPFTRGPLTAPVIAGGKVYLARPHAHQIVALDARSGEEYWRFTANGRIDRPPTIHKGLCLFGTASGFVYCLRADDGGLVWRFRAAPADQRIVAYGQVESPWPVPGSVLVVDDVAYVAAGRQSLADGGIRVFALRPASGQVLWSKVLDSVPQKNFYFSSGLEFDNFDLMHAEDDGVSLSRWFFDRKTGTMTCREKSGFAHLVTGGSGVIVPRGFWSYAPREESEKSGDRPFVRPLLSFRDNRLFGLSEDRKTVFRRDFDLEGVKDFDTVWFKGWSTYENARQGGDLWRTQRLARGAQWTTKAFADLGNTHRGGALALAANALLLASQQGGLSVLSLDDGKTLSQLKIPPVAWDGLAIAGDGVYVSTQDGQILCLEGR